MSVYKHRIFLASGSKSRLKLLQDAYFEVAVLDQICDERSVTVPSNNPEDLVKLIADIKMDCVIMPQVETLAEHECEGLYIVTADSMVEDMQGQVHGKPDDYADAIKKIKSMREGSFVHTGFCVEKRKYSELKQSWERVGERYNSVDSAWCFLDIPDDKIELYLTVQPIAVGCAGGMAMEGPGGLFVREIRGAYSTLIGLPLHQLKDALDAVGFFD
ncbi:MAG: Maf-like protein [candidate division TM6 bacterium GW2011_GWE2_41_16]|nr:MAG: Maf-like protein [candidate division TM6 bacterium GW2011_GWE2_41_16]